ncbi:MAG: phosphotransferase [Pseudomonadota bacterium]
MSEPTRPAIPDARDAQITEFLTNAGWAGATRRHLSGDASNRRYERVAHPECGRAVLMDAPADPAETPLEGAGRSYADIAHLAQDCRAFVAVARHLGGLGLSAPQIYAWDLKAGLLLLEDFGDGLYGHLLEAGSADQAEAYYGEAVDVLARVHAQAPPEVLSLPDGSGYALSRYDRDAQHIEVSLLIDWYAPALLDRQIDAGPRAEFVEIWDDLLAEPEAAPPQLVLRDVHSPNLMWLADREGANRVGLLDFQDALIGCGAYDLVSLLQDARRDVPADLEARLFKRYCTAAGPLDEKTLRTQYAILGAQRASKIIGIFARLKQRDNKPGYLRHLPRVWRYLERNLAHPRLHRYQQWVDMHFPPETRNPPHAPE